MGERIKLSRLPDRLQELEYPTTRADAAAACADDVLVYADGEGNLGEIIAEMNHGEFESATDLLESLQGELPIEAVGEPGQSEGDA